MTDIPHVEENSAKLERIERDHSRIRALSAEMDKAVEGLNARNRHAAEMIRRLIRGTEA